MERWRPPDIFEIYEANPAGSAVIYIEEVTLIIDQVIFLSNREENVQAPSNK